jgi:hypothetical protein
MKIRNLNWMIACGWVSFLAAAIVTLFAWFAGSDKTEERRGTKPGKNRIDSQGREVTERTEASRTISSQRLRRDPNPSPGNPAEFRLWELHSEGDLSAIHSELSAMADAHDLQSVGNVLEVWCRDGRMELAQFCIVLSENESDLNLELCGAALANPSEIIRDLAASRLENASGIAFETPADAKDWLKSRAKP